MVAVSVDRPKWRIEVAHDGRRWRCRFSRADVFLEEQAGEGAFVALLGPLRDRLACLREQAGDRLLALEVVLREPAVEEALRAWLMAQNGWGQGVRWKVTLAGRPPARSPVKLAGSATSAERVVAPPRFDRAAFTADVKALSRRLAREHPEAPAAERAIDALRMRARAIPEQADRKRALGLVGTAVARARDFHRWKALILSLAVQNGADCPDVHDAIERAACVALDPDGFRRELAGELAAAATGRQTEAAPRPPMEHRIHQLPEAEAWTLYIDEGGNMPSDMAAVAGNARACRFVGVLIPAATKLPRPREGFHAVSATDESRLALLKNLDAEPVGVLGIEIGAVEAVDVDPWLLGVTTLIEWVVRLLPATKSTRLAVRIEQFGPYAPGMDWRAFAALCRQHLARIDRERSRNLRLEPPVIIPKEGDSFEAYADLLAHCWSSPNPTGWQRLFERGMLRTCLHVGEASELVGVWDALEADRAPTVATWRNLIMHPGVDAPNSLAALVLARTGELCRREPERWHAFLAAVDEHLECGAVALEQLVREVTFLDRYAPDDVALEPAMRLVWLTAGLQAANHVGEVMEAREGELDEACAALMREHPDLVAQADLVRAVLATNRFDFPAATSALGRWTGGDVTLPLLLEGRLTSTLGQHAAFQGRYEAAEAYFVEALRIFDDLSTEAARLRERAWTGTYRAIAAMDDPSRSAEEVRELVGAIVDLTPTGIRALAAEASPARRFAHHVLVRWLAMHGGEAERRAYLAERGHWAMEQGHPWPLIAAYRGLLLHAEGAAEEATSWFEVAVRATSADMQGPTVSFIGLVVSRVAASLELAVDLTGIEREVLEAQLPRAPWASLERSDLKGLALLEACLPFNFR